MVEQLTEKVLALEEANEQLQEELSDLTEIVDMNEELEETHQLTEKELKEDLAASGMLPVAAPLAFGVFAPYSSCCIPANTIQELQLALQHIHNEKEEAVVTAVKLRDLVEKLQGELGELRDSHSEITSKTVAKESEIEKMASLNVQLASTADKARSNAVQMELHKIEAEQASNNIR